MALWKQIVVALVFFCLCVSCHTITKHQIELSRCYDTICWNEEEYPTEVIYSEFEKMYGETVNAFGHIHNHNTDMTSDMEEPMCKLCKHKVSLRVSPVTLRDGSDLFYVVRSDKYQQTIMLNICEPEHLQKSQKSICMVSNEILNFRMACEQKSTFMKLLVYDPKQARFTEKVIQYPSACVCIIQKTEDKKRSV